ncbi:15439_t:CDS:1, partial [Racocetra persica]
MQIFTEQKTVLAEVNGTPSGYVNLYNACISYEPKERLSLKDILDRLKELSKENIEIIS